MARRGLRDFAKRHWMARAAGQDPQAPQAEPDDEDLFVDPPMPDAVARRAAILAAVVTRGLIESDDSLEEPASVLADDLAFYDRLDLGRDAEPAEDAMVRAPHGTLDAQTMIDATWRAEGLAVLAWTLGRLDALPPIDETVDLSALAGALEMPWSRDEDPPFLRSAHLRPADHLEQLDAQLLTAHWRVRQFLRIDQGSMDYVAWVPGVEWAQLTLDGLEVADRDLAIGGLPISEADPDLVELSESILRERRLAVSWLHGYDALYSEGDTNT